MRVEATTPCDCEIIAWSAKADAGISGKMVRDLIIAAVERHFGTTKVPHRVEQLSDRGGLDNLDRCDEWSFCLSAARMVAEQERR